MNVASVIILLLVAVAVVLAVRSLVRRGGGCGTCGGGCEGCDKGRGCDGCCPHAGKGMGMVLLLLATSATAMAGDGDAILSRIKAAHKDVATIESSFTHERTTARGKKSVRNGIFYYVDSTRQMAMRYSNPSSMYFIVSNGHLYNGLNKIPLHFNMKRNAIMRALGNAMVWAVRGDVQNIIDDNNVDTRIYEEEGFYVISMTARNGFNRGITRIVLKYEKSHCLLRHMEVEEIIKVNHVFLLGNDTKTNRPVDAKRFVL